MDRPPVARWPAWTVPVIVGLLLNAGAIVYSWGSMTAQVESMQKYFDQRMSRMESQIDELMHMTRGPKGTIVLPMVPDQQLK